MMSERLGLIEDRRGEHGQQVLPKVFLPCVQSLPRHIISTYMLQREQSSSLRRLFRDQFIHPIRNPYKMSVAYPLSDPPGRTPAFQRIPVIPVMARPFVSNRAKRTLDIVERFVEEECVPAEAVYAA